MKEATQLVFEFKQEVKPLVQKRKRWDTRPDGRVFWQYSSKAKNNERWITLDAAMRARESDKKTAARKRAKNPDRHKELNRLWREKNQKRHQENARAYYKANRLQANETKRKRRAERRKSDPVFALKTRIRTLISKAFKNKSYGKTSQSSAILGCDWLTLKIHIESQFQEGMSWDNRSQWHIDHIVPLATAKSQEEVARLNHYKNLRPLWALDNLKKGAKSL